ncbi:GNAT family N-acetyltransferase [Gordonia sp. PKS22-38]|uniref:GNAT family N-acetyltransferase n=1 Tax=Gordonia prachuapensis TaxID=3115651 RepID=A0ABU7MXT2_9ACTN|nr:GNAT family N-acetyltransferase [Gordonia sp. PKS22-38]
MILETVRLRLRPVTVSDVDALVALDSDPLVMRFVSGGAPTPREVIEGWVLPRAEAERRAHRTGMWAATDRRTDHFRGWFALRTPRHSHRPELELSYRLQREHWGRGLATEAAHALLTMSFRELGAERVFAGTMSANTASRRVMEKIGMRLSAIHLCEDDVVFGSGAGEVEYELLRSHWETTTMSWSSGQRAVRAPLVPAAHGPRHAVAGLTA